MFARVVCFLHHKGADLGFELGRGALAMCLDRFDEHRLALGKGNRQRIVPRGRHGIAAEPPASGLALATETHVAHCQRKVFRGRRVLAERFCAI